VPDVTTNAFASTSERAQCVENVNVDETRVGLAGGDVGLLESRLLSHEFIEALDSGMVSLKDGQETALGTGCSLDTAERVHNLIALGLEVAQVAEQVGDPQTRTLADGDELGGLTVGVSEAGEVAVLHGESSQTLDDGRKLGKDEVEGIAKEDLLTSDMEAMNRWLNTHTRSALSVT
jgi:hypothetical protein